MAKVVGSNPIIRFFVLRALRGFTTALRRRHLNSNLKPR